MDYLWEVFLGNMYEYDMLRPVSFSRQQLYLY